MVADVGMHGVGEVDGACAFRQFADVAVGREHVDLVREQIDLQVLDELQGIPGALLQVEQAGHPLARPVALPACRFIVAEEPVPGDAVLRHRLHLPRSYLHVDGRGVHAHQRGVQRLVAVRLGNGDVVLEAAGHGLVEIVQHAEGAIAGVHAIDFDAEDARRGDVGERAPLRLHLAVDGIEVTAPRPYPGVDALAPQGALDGALQLRHHRVAMAVNGFRRPPDAVRAQREQRLERQFLELDAHQIHAEAVGDGGVEVQRFAGDQAALLQRHDADGAHVVQAVGELDENHAQIARRRHRHLLEVLGLRFGARLEDRRQLGDAVDDFRHVAPEGVDERLLRHAGVFEHVVQHGGGDGLRVHAHGRQDVGDRQGMRDVAVAGAPELAGVGFGGEAAGLLNHLHFGGGEVVAQNAKQIVDGGGRGDPGRQGLLAQLRLKVAGDAVFAGLLAPRLALARAAPGSFSAADSEFRSRGRRLDQGGGRARSRLRGHLPSRRRTLPSRLLPLLPRWRHPPHRAVRP